MLLNLSLLCQHHYCVWWWTLCGDRCHYCVNTTVVCGLWMEAVDTIVSTSLTCVVVDCVATDDTMMSTPLLCVDWELRQLTLLCHHHWRVSWWTLCGDRWHYYVNTTAIYELQLTPVHTQCLCWVCVTRSFVFRVVFCTSLFILLFLSFWPLCCMSIFQLRFLFTLLVSVKPSCHHITVPNTFVLVWGCLNTVP